MYVHLIASDSQPSLKVSFLVLPTETVDCYILEYNNYHNQNNNKNNMQYQGISERTPRRGDDVTIITGHKSSKKLKGYYLVL